MIGILFIYWIWKAFADLAEEYGKNKWLYFFIGIGSYYGGTIISGFILGICLALLGDPGAVDENALNVGWNLFFMLCGGLSCYGIYRLLEYKGEKERELLKEDSIDNIGINNENQG
ncbi:hypothetical protein RB619_12620 [Flavobacterium sp. LHD-80]|uniref:hypothetical protein n=1 Tax=Flavobacterium sp. LHD-80 TaxID=3071411 RepID=UPI0027DF9B8A|nr:hypothetical protein [Flavobacterium sp. LHD-80]MDQ6471490.1 hypothetical protein [Flavobacterium sp. LHD-80]